MALGFFRSNLSPGGSCLIRQLQANSNSNSPDSAKELSAGASVSEFADEAVPYRRKDPPESAPHGGDVASAGADLERNAVSPRLVIESVFQRYILVVCCDVTDWYA